MTYFDELEREPWRFDFFDMMRRVERSLGTALPAPPVSGNSRTAVPIRVPRPRIGDSGSRREEVIQVRGRGLSVSFGQDPWMVFPASNICELQWRPTKLADVIKRDIEAESEAEEVALEPDRIHIVVRFLGLLGPQGALPLATTEEAHGWLVESDPSFAHYLDVFNNRFLQLFYRAWADSRPIVQHDRVDCDRFREYVNSVIGIGSPAFANLDTVPRGISLYAGILGSQTKSASRLCSVIRGLFDVDVEIVQLVGSWLTFDEPERSSLGCRNSMLGDDFLVGAASFSVQDKILIRLFVKDMDRYRRFLPHGADCRALVDLLFFYVGNEIDWDTELALPARYVTAVRLGLSGELGWTSWMSPNYAPDEHRCDARFNPAERARREREIPANMEGKATK
ncbi:MAG: type VI secretion system baseplate subunit TssG [Methylocella sp.]